MADYDEFGNEVSNEEFVEVKDYAVYRDRDVVLQLHTPVRVKFKSNATKRIFEKHTGLWPDNEEGDADGQ